MNMYSAEMKKNSGRVSTYCITKKAQMYSIISTTDKSKNAQQK